MTTPDRDVYETPLCPAGCAEATCRDGLHERVPDHPFTKTLDFYLIVLRLREDGGLSFMQFAGIALMVNSERRSASSVPLNWFEHCSTCGAGAEGCEHEPNLLAILAQEEGGSEWQ